MNDADYMKLALSEASKALQEGEIPIGAVITYKGLIIAAAHNRKENKKDPTCHAEIEAIREASRVLSRWRLTGTSLYVTIEPCPMCAGAILSSRISRVIYGAPNKQYGAFDSVFHLNERLALNYKTEIVSGILSSSCQDIMNQFFRQKRAQGIP